MANMGCTTEPLIRSLSRIVLPRSKYDALIGIAVFLHHLYLSLQKLLLGLGPELRSDVN
jgi:hypothetical protein